MEWSYPTFTIFVLFFPCHEQLDGVKYTFKLSWICVKLKLHVWKCIDGRREQVKIVIFTQIKSAKQTQMGDGTKFNQKKVLETFAQMSKKSLLY